MVLDIVVSQIELMSYRLMEVQPVTLCSTVINHYVCQIVSSQNGLSDYICICICIGCTQISFVFDDHFVGLSDDHFMQNATVGTGWQAQGLVSIFVINQWCYPNRPVIYWVCQPSR